MHPSHSLQPGHQAAALLAWWRVAGADTLLTETPRSWLSLAGAAASAQPDPVAATLPASAPNPAPEPPVAWVPAAATLADFLAEVRSRHLLAPIADGNPASGIMILGEAPSAEDLRTGRPFTGPAGILLDQMLDAIGLDRSSCYISLVAPRRRIPGTPPPEAIAADLPLTRAHIQLASPRLMLLLGATAAQELSGKKDAISTLRGRWQTLTIGEQMIPALPSFNPAYLLRRHDAKRDAWADLLAFKQRMAA